VPKAQIPHNYVRVAQHGQYGPSNWVNVFYFLMASGGPPTVPHVTADAAAQVSSFYNHLGFGNFPTNWTTTYAKVLYVDSGGSVNRATIADASPGVGSGGGQDAQVCYLINWATTDPRRGGKARQYVPGVLDSLMADPANLNSTIQATMNAGILEWLADIEAGDDSPNGTMFQPVEMSFVDAKADRATPLGYAISSGTVNPVVATQRRRVDRLRPA